ncbi:CHAT domain-containing protein [Dactylosporangium cerinum]|uniref:CHAT domain-containing protein n=1 Tax=Dactylosporangium cerinum TaxID=1434730 RepID=A0ABV9W9A5_9ACTN
MSLRGDAAARWPHLLDEIRQVAGFEGFALPPAMEALHEAAGVGTVVAITVTRHGCGALWLDRDDAGSVELPDLTMSDAAEHARDFLDAMNTPSGLVDAAGIARVLAWLWDAVAGPVLDALGHTIQPDVQRPDGWPRVWWIPTGPLSVLPLHAAGHHDDPPQARRSVLDRVVSSYTPSVRVLADARGRIGRPTSGMAVGINQTAGSDLPPLRKAETEASGVARLVHRDAPPLLGPDATHEAVMRRLPEAGWAHFACHGFVDHDDPGQSYLALYDAPLKVHELFNVELRNPYLAFLSACTTGQGSTRLPDESIHLASGFQLAGYPHVIATLWPINDSIAVRLAERIYTAIHPAPESWHEPGLALHRTVHAYRERYPSAPQIWASHVHFGP